MNLLFVFLVLSLSTATQVVNLAFTTSQRSPADKLFGSVVLRSYMIMESMKKNAHCNSSSLLYVGNPGKVLQAMAQLTYQLDACVFVKWIKKEVAEKCRQIGALVLVDVVDNDLIMEELLDKKKPAKKHGRKFPADSTIYLVQSEHFATQLSHVGVSAYSYPHHHTNSEQWGRQPVVTDPEHKRLVVGFLAGSYRNIPDNFQQTILPTVCRANMTFWVIDQKIVAMNLNNSRTVVSTRKVFSCDNWTRDTSTSIFPITEQNFTTTTNFSYDRFGQAAFFLDEALVGVDIGLVWPAHEMENGHPNIDMLRPPTRFLHWMSRGVPTLYYPTYAYTEVATAMNRKRSKTRSHGGAVQVADRTYGYTAHMSAAVSSSKSLYEALLSLRSPLARQNLQKEGYRIAEQYTADRMARRLMDIILSVRFGV